MGVDLEQNAAPCRRGGLGASCEGIAATCDQIFFRCSLSAPSHERCSLAIALRRTVFSRSSSGSSHQSIRVAVTMDSGPLVLMNCGPPSGVWRAGPGCGKHRLKVANVGVSLTDGGLGQTRELAANGEHAQRLAVLPDDLALELAHQAMPAQGATSRASYSAIVGIVACVRATVRAWSTSRCT